MIFRDSWAHIQKSERRKILGAQGPATFTEVEEVFFARGLAVARFPFEWGCSFARFRVAPAHDRYPLEIKRGN